jgi:hypothetical protein
MQFMSDFNAAVAPNGGAARGLDRALRVPGDLGLLHGENSATRRPHGAA